MSEERSCDELPFDNEMLEFGSKVDLLYKDIMQELLVDKKNKIIMTKITPFSQTTFEVSFGPFNMLCPDTLKVACIRINEDSRKILENINSAHAK